MQESEKARPGGPGPAEQNPSTDKTQENVARYSSTSHLRDHVDWVLDGWQKERPDFATESIGIITRLERLQTYIRAEVSTLFERFDLSGPSFAVLATLRRVGQPYQLSQRALTEFLQLTGGTISVRIDRLERAGLVERSPDPHDQRGVLVQLTPKGEHLFEQVAPLHLANEERLLSALDTQQREQLANLLRLLLLSFDPIAQEDPAHPSRWLGATLVPAHQARKLRRSSGLPDLSGLLIQHVVLPGPANAAGLREGDLIITANGQTMRSIENLYEQLLKTRGTALALEIVRGTESQSLQVYPDEQTVT